MKPREKLLSDDHRRAFGIQYRAASQTAANRLIDQIR